jgi:hypothetical protein
MLGKKVLHFFGCSRVRVGTHSRGKIKIVIIRDATKERESAKGGQREDDRGE